MEENRMNINWVMGIYENTFESTYISTFVIK